MFQYIFDTLMFRRPNIGPFRATAILAVVWTLSIFGAAVNAPNDVMNCVVRPLTCAITAIACSVMVYNYHLKNVVELWRRETKRWLDQYDDTRPLTVNVTGDYAVTQSVILAGALIVMPYVFIFAASHITFADPLALSIVVLAAWVSPEVIFSIAAPYYYRQLESHFPLTKPKLSAQDYLRFNFKDKTP